MLFDSATFYTPSWIFALKKDKKKKINFVSNITRKNGRRQIENWWIATRIFAILYNFFSSFIYSWPQAINWVNHEGKIFVVYRIYCCETAAAALYIKINYHFSYFFSTIVSKGFFLPFEISETKVFALKLNNLNFVHNNEIQGWIGLGNWSYLKSNITYYCKEMQNGCYS